MCEKLNAFGEMRKKEYELDEKRSEYLDAKDAYCETLSNETKENILKVLADEGNLTRRDLDIFLNDLTIKVKNLYSK